jgi:uncharacterized PurR-regulated membrane protein YhhQ (DUF165 family)
LLATGVSLFLVIGIFTWLRPQPDFQRDPFEGLRENGGFAFTLGGTHLQLLPTNSPAVASVLIYAVFITLIVLLTVETFRRKKGQSEQMSIAHLISPLGLLALATLLSSLLSLISLANSYWILPRQWVASLALIPVALVWLVYEITASLRGRNIYMARVFAGISIALVIVLGTNRLWNQWQVTQSEITQFNEWRNSGALAEARDRPQSTTNEEWTILANNNVIVGGEVWPEIAAYYGY